MFITFKFISRWVNIQQVSFGDSLNLAVRYTSVAFLTSHANAIQHFEFTSSGWASIRSILKVHSSGCCLLESLRIWMLLAWVYIQKDSSLWVPSRWMNLQQVNIGGLLICLLLTRGCCLFESTYRWSSSLLNSHRTGQFWRFIYLDIPYLSVAYWGCCSLESTSRWCSSL